MRGCNVLILKAAKGILFVGFFFFAVHTALAAGGDIVLTVTDELGSSLSGATFSFACAGGTTKSIVDGGVDDDDAAADGTITILASVAQNGPDCDDGESFIVDDVQGDGYVTIDSSLATYSTSTANVAAPSLQFGFKVTILTVDGIPAYNATTISAEKGFKTTCIEDGITGVYYCPVPLANKNKVVKFEKDYFDTQIEQFPTDRTSATDPQVVTTISDVIYTTISGITISKITVGGSFMRIGWTTTTDPNFERYEVHRRRTTPGVNYTNADIMTPISSPTIDNIILSGSGSNEPNYFVVYAIDADGNRSFISSEVSARTGSGSAPKTPAVASIVQALVAEEAAVTPTPFEEQITEEIITEVEEEIVEEVVETQPLVEEVVETQEIVIAEEITGGASVVEEPPPPLQEEEILEEVSRPSQRIVPPAVPRENELRTSTLSALLNVVPKMVVKIQSNFQASVQIIKERFSDGVRVGSAFRENTALLIATFKAFLGIGR